VTHFFASDASHELRTPLTSIKSVGEVALRRSKARPRGDLAERAYRRERARLKFGENF
jgi:signal transduction histidine kinase